MTTQKIATIGEYQPKKRSKLLGVGVGITLSVLLLVAVSTAYWSGIFVSAGNDAPTELIIRNVGDTSAEIYWTTQDETQGILQYGTNPTELTLIAPEVTSSKEHIQNLSLLQPASTYYFRIKVGDKEFDNGGLPWTFATKESGATASPEPVGAEPSTELSEPDVTVDPASFVCPKTSNCDEIKNRLGAGCQTSDYIMCLQGK